MGMDACHFDRLGKSSVLGLVVVSGAAGNCHAQYGPPDRTAVTKFMSQSDMVLTDLNGDEAVSDVDVALALLDRLTELYGPELAVGDQDQDGAETYQDIVTAIGKLMKGAYGKTASDGKEAVGAADVQRTGALVSGGGLAGDLNFDGAVNADDLGVTTDRFGQEVNEYDVEQAAQLATEYVGAIVRKGTEAFMATGTAPLDHLEGVSNTWPPDHPSWWRPNHLVSISEGYEGEPPDPPHDYYYSQHIPTEPHTTTVSRQWPPNHDWYASSTWDPPGTHDFFSTTWEPEDYHETAVSRSWWPGHMEAASATYPGNHETLESRTWWPNHTYDDSQSLIMPPLHDESFTSSWSHDMELSQSIWPPNHADAMSGTWGPTHSIGVSVNFPPGHLSYASNTWPGPQPTWPPGHTLVISESWGDPSPGDWPVFPPDHSWWTTFQDITDFIDRFPWPF